jgi:hypothetical protein
MSITVKVSDIVAAVPTLTKITQQKMSGVAVFELSKSMKLLQAELNAYEETRVALVKQYGEPDNSEGGNGEVKVTGENMQAFVTDLNKVMATEVELAINPVAIENAATIELTVEEMGAVSFLFC